MTVDEHSCRLLYEHRGHVFQVILVDLVQTLMDSNAKPLLLTGRGRLRSDQRRGAQDTGQQQRERTVVQQFPDHTIQLQICLYSLRTSLCHGVLP